MTSWPPLEAKVAFLKKISLFAGLSKAELVALAGDVRFKEYNRGEFICHQGDDSNELYIVWKGKVRIFKLSPAGDETSINIFGPGSVIGEFSAIDRQPRSATAKAITACTLVTLAADILWRRMRQMPDLALNMTRLVVGKARWTAEYAETIARYDPASRLLHLLLLYNQQLGREIEPGKRYDLDLGLNQTDLASLIGVQREYVNRLLRDWRRRGLITYKGSKITILDLPGMKAERDSRIEADG